MATCAIPWSKKKKTQSGFQKLQSNMTTEHRRGQKNTGTVQNFSPSLLSVLLFLRGVEFDAPLFRATTRIHEVCCAQVSWLHREKGSAYIQGRSEPDMGTELVRKVNLRKLAEKYSLLLKPVSFKKAVKCNCANKHTFS